MYKSGKIEVMTVIVISSEPSFKQGISDSQRILVPFKPILRGTETSSCKYACVCTRRVCVSNIEPKKACTVDIYST